MFRKNRTHETQQMRAVSADPAQVITQDDDKMTDLRRQMYERIARGHAVAEAETTANRMNRR